jgi:hypothetical protein
MGCILSPQTAARAGVDGMSRTGPGDGKGNGVAPSEVAIDQVAHAEIMTIAASEVRGDERMTLQISIPLRNHQENLPSPDQSSTPLAACPPPDSDFVLEWLVRSRHDPLSSCLAAARRGARTTSAAARA